jgi:lysine-N-methylase
MTRFRCTGGACADNCCHHWRIPVDREHHDALLVRLRSPEERAALKKSDDGDPQCHALMALDDAGRCRFLDEARLCTIHARFGADLLPNGCAAFPRVIGTIGGRAELVGSTSGPEVARLVLAADDGAELVTADVELFGRGYVSRTIAADTTDDYERSFLAVRGLVLVLLGLRRYPIASRLFFVAAFADRAQAQLRRGVGQIDAAALQYTGRALQAPATLDRLHAELAGAVIDDAFAISVVRELLGLPAQFTPPAFRAIRDELGPLGDVVEVDRAYRALPPLPAELAARLDGVVERYARNHVQGEWYVRAPTFVGYVHGLLARVAVIRYLIRRLVPPAGQGPAAFDALAVRVVYALSRLLEHNASLAARLIRDLEAQGMTEREHAIRLLRI